VQLNNQKNKFIPWLILIALSLIWGSSFILMKRGLEAFSFTQVAALRIFIAFIFIIPFTLKAVFKIPKKYWLYLIMAAFLGNGIPPFLFTKAQTHLNSSMAGILNALTPLFTFILGIAFFHTKTRWYQFLGVALGLAGAVGLLISSGDNNFENISYGIYIVIATLCYAMGTNIVKRYLQEVNALHMAGFIFLVTGVPIGIYLFFSEVFIVLKTNDKAIESLSYIAILAVFGSALSLVLWNVLIQKTTAVFAASVTYIMPVIAILWGVADGEKFLPVFMLMILIILIGIYLTNKK